MTGTQLDVVQRKEVGGGCTSNSHDHDSSGIGLHAPVNIHTPWSDGIRRLDAASGAGNSSRRRHIDTLVRAAELEGQLRTELAVSRQHLRETITQYWDRDWRRLHKGHDASPEDHLWRAATAVSEMHDALEELETAKDL